MDKIERVMAALAGAPVDRPPYSFWTHMPAIDLDARALADATAAFARELDLDFVKSMPNNLFVVEDWGCRCDYSDVASGGVGKVVDHAIKRGDDWRRLTKLDVTRGAFGRELDYLTRLVSALGPDGPPILATVFSPITVAKKLSGPMFRQSVEACADDLRQGLEAITDTMSRFARAALGRGVSGVFFATQQATFHELGDAEFAAFGSPFDRQVLAAAREDAWFNVLHIHGLDIAFDLVKDYDVDALSWHIGETPPTIAAYRSSGGKKAIVGGLARSNITSGNVDATKREIDSAIDDSGGRGLLLAPSCSIRHPVDTAELAALAGEIRMLGRNSSSPR